MPAAEAILVIVALVALWFVVARRLPVVSTKTYVAAERRTFWMQARRWGLGVTVAGLLVWVSGLRWIVAPLAYSALGGR